MNQTINDASEKERDLIEVMNKRYTEDISASARVALNEAYAKGMKSLIQKYPHDLNIKALYIDAVMVEHPWDFWYSNGEPKEWTNELVGLCQDILKINPYHPAALHYYIHTVEASHHPELALHSADVLKDLMPGVSHMVHMSSHMYIRNGLFTKGVEVNEKAKEAIDKYDAIAPNLNIKQTSHGKLVHTFHVQTYCSINAGMYEQTMQLAARSRQSVSAELLNGPPPFRNYAQYVYMTPVIALVRLGKWEEIFNSPAPDKRWVYAGLLNDFAKGLAFIHNNNISAANKSLDSLRVKLKDSVLTVRHTPYNAPIMAATIAEKILTGEVLFTEKKFDEAIVSFKEAVLIEDSMIYREPKEWPIPARQFLGAYLMKLNRFVDAENIYREDLKLNPNNGWSLLGLYQSLHQQHKYNEAKKYKEKYLTAFSNAEAEPYASVF